MFLSGTGPSIDWLPPLGNIQFIVGKTDSLEYYFTSGIKCKDLFDTTRNYHQEKSVKIHVD